MAILRQIKNGSDYQNPYSKPANAIDQHFFNPNDPVDSFNDTGAYQLDRDQVSADPYTTIMNDFKAAQARRAQARPRKGAASTPVLPDAPAAATYSTDQP